MNVPLPYPLLGPKYWEAYRSALADYIADREPGARSQIGADRTKPGSFRAAFIAYTSSATFKVDLAPSTQRAHLNILRRIVDESGEYPIRPLQRRHVANMVERRAETPAAAQVFLKVLRRMMQYCVLIGLIEQDPTQGVKPPKQRTTGYRSWTDEEIAQYRKCHALGSTARTAFELLLETAQRRSDVVRMGRQHLRNDAIHVVQQKTGWTGDIPITPELAAALDKVPAGNLTFLMTAWGAPFTAAGFGNAFRQWREEAGLSRDCVMHGLRKAQCRLLAEKGCTPHEIASISGHITLAEVQRYTKDADQLRLARAARAKTGTQIGEPEIRFSKTGL
jgi:integrase